VREEAFKNEVAYLGLSRESVCFKGVDGRHNSSSSAASPYSAAALTGRSSLPFSNSNNSSNSHALLRGSNHSTSGAGGGSESESAGSGGSGTRNPLSSSNAAHLEGLRVHNEWHRQSELEMRTTKGSCKYISSFMSTGSIQHVK
jgi:hypothetical protein